jgi:hypothetical protein
MNHVMRYLSSLGFYWDRFIMVSIKNDRFFKQKVVYLPNVDEFVKSQNS